MQSPEFKQTFAEDEYTMECAVYVLTTPSGCGFILAAASDKIRID
jgi:hypothetical protein